MVECIPLASCRSSGYINVFYDCRLSRCSARGRWCKQPPSRTSRLCENLVHSLAPILGPPPPAQVAETWRNSPCADVVVRCFRSEGETGVSIFILSAPSTCITSLTHPATNTGLVISTSGSGSTRLSLQYHRFSLVALWLSLTSHENSRPAWCS
jgi:hypothetical protein